MFLFILTLVAVLIQLAAIVLILRSWLVYRERIRVVKEIYRLGKTEPLEVVTARYRDFETISYNEMVWKFWKPVKSFYRGAACIQEKMKGLTTMFPENDDNYEERTITEVRDYEDGWQIGCDSTFFFLAKPSPVEPKNGMTVRTYGSFGYPIRGVFLNGKMAYYRTKEQEKVRHAEEVVANNLKKKMEFEGKREEYFARIAALPEVFQRRLKRFQDNNPDFDWDFGGYEVFCCEQALLFANTLGTMEALDKWTKLEFEQQKIGVPGLDDGHSGNTLGCAIRLAYHYLSNQENVVREHGALVPLVGCVKYGCLHTSEAT